MTSNVKKLNEIRASIVDNIRSNFDFGNEIIVEAMDGWAYDEPGDIMTSNIYVRATDQVGDSTKLTFTVVFENYESSEVVEVYVIDNSGNILF